MCVNVALTVDLSRDAVAHLDILTHTHTQIHRRERVHSLILTMQIHTRSHCSAVNSAHFEREYLNL